MNSFFTAEFFETNRKSLRKLFTGTAPIVITANGLLQRSGDTSFDFQQDSNFWYLTGIDEPDIVLVMDKDKEYLIVPERETNQQTFDGAIDADELTQRSGITTVFDHKTGWKQLSERIKKVKHVAVLGAPSPYVSGHGMYTNPARAVLIAKLKEFNSEVELLDLRDHLTRLRMIKQLPELKAIALSINITNKTLRSVIKKRQSFKYENELEASITQGFRKRGAQHGYQPIVANGKNACTLHYVKNEAVLEPKNPVLIDVGAEIEHYSADITRTIALSPPTKRQQTVYDTVLEVQQFAMSILKPNVLIKDYERQVAQFMGEKLRELGLIKSITEDNLRQYYPHATSHFLGLDVHDSADYNRPLEAGMVLTVEPGIYIPKENLGIRIEDDVVVTTKGIKVLSKNLPRLLW